MCSSNSWASLMLVLDDLSHHFWTGETDAPGAIDDWASGFAEATQNLRP